MCLAVPAEVVSLDGNTAKVDIAGNRRECLVDLEFGPDDEDRSYVARRPASPSWVATVERNVLRLPWSTPAAVPALWKARPTFRWSTGPPLPVVEARPWVVSKPSAARCC